MQEIQKDGCIIIKILVLANSVISVHFNTNVYVPSKELVCPFSPNFYIICRYVSSIKYTLNFLLGGISVFYGLPQTPCFRDPLLYLAPSQEVLDTPLFS